MNYKEHQQLRDHLLSNEPSVVDLGQTNIWRALSTLVPPTGSDRKERIHRCHLAQQWVEAFGLPDDWNEVTMISSGVRHSLSLLFPEVARRQIDLRIPSDVYPVYQQLAVASGLSPQTFPTADCQFATGLGLPSCGDWILLPNPVKPAGRWLSDHEVGALCDWLAAQKNRRLLLDTVYNLQPQFHASTLRLFATGQTYVLYSLSKAWLHPQVMGVCLAPAADLDWVMPIFRDNAPEQSMLRVADELLRKHVGTPLDVDAAVQASRSRMEESLPSAVRERYSVCGEAAGYFAIVDVPFERLLEEHRMLSIPLTVFGSDAPNLSVISSLSLARHSPYGATRRRQ